MLVIISAGGRALRASFGRARLLASAIAASFVLGGALSACTTRAPTAGPVVPPGAIDAARLEAADTESQNWFTAGRDKDGTYYSPLKTIDTGNADRLGFAWQYDLGTHRGQEATPIVVDGVMYTSGTWGYVYAVDAATGKELWRYDPHAEPAAARNPCCDLVNRGVAVWKGRVYVAAVDGRLHAIDAGTGQKVWDSDTIVDHSLAYSSTGTPQIAGKVVVIGNSGSDMGKGGVRGYVSAYDLETGAFKWRFYTVPGAPGQPYEHPELAAADKTWDPKRGPEFRGGGTAWDGFAYDAKLDLVYFGTANAAPYDLRQLGPSKLDSLYTASILAVEAATGRLAWHYQTTPKDRWDFDAAQKLILADVPVNGVARSVLMQANKNGFFYVLDRKTGEVLSAKPFTYVNWASGVDLKTGRPMPTAQGDWYTGPKNVYPSWAGGHTWHPMSYSAATRLVYIPVLDVPNIWVDMRTNGGAVKFLDGFYTVNGIMPDDTYDPVSLKPFFGPLPALKELQHERKEKMVREMLRAWDPVAEKVVWEHETSSGVRGYDGGVLSTGGNLVIQGRGSPTVILESGLGQGREAWTSYHLLERLRESTYLEARLHTGRTHQIRVHFLHLGHALVGDAIYGKRFNNGLTELTGFKAPRQLLHAHKLAFNHPISGQRMSFVAPVPEDFQSALAALRPQPALAAKTATSF